MALATETIESSVVTNRSDSDHIHNWTKLTYHRTGATTASSNRPHTSSTKIMSNETAHAHRNVRKREYHHPAIPAGVASKEVSDFVRSLVGRTLDLESEFPPTDGWHGFVEWEREPERAKLASTILKWVVLRL